MVNKRSYFFFITLYLFFIHLQAQEANRWTSHLSYAADIESLEKNEDTVYALTDGKLFSYNNSDSSIEIYVKENGGNSDITHIKYSTKLKCLVITRADANIELLLANKSYLNISDLKDWTQNLDKTINNVFLHEDFAYMATNFGFLIANLVKREIQESGEFNIPFYSMVLEGNKLYAATANGILQADLTDNIKDFAVWKKLEVSTLYTGADNKFTDNEIRDILFFKNQLYFIIPRKAVYRMDSPTSVKMVLAGNNLVSMQHSPNDHLIVKGNNAFWDYENVESYTKMNIDGLTSVIPNGNRTGEYWEASSGNNLALIKTDESTYKYIKRHIVPGGPVSNYPFSLTYQNKQLLVTGGGFYFDRLGKPASLSILRNSRWMNLYPSDIKEASGINSRDLVYAVSDPTNQNNIFASSWGEGLYEFDGTKFQTRYDESNSTIEALVVGDNFTATRVSGMVFDKNNNLWMLNSMVKNILKVRLKNGTWTQVYYPQIANADTNPKNLVIDKYGNKWITTFGKDTYLFIFNDNGTINDTSDDKTLFLDRSKFADQDGKSLLISDINAIAEDVNGNFWLGTNIGPYLVYTNNVFSEQLTFRKIKVESNSGTNTVTGLLENVAINAIAIDGANRKWFGTETAGVYLIDSDNQELHHFTVENSPLPSNSILSLAIDPNTGVVFIGTERGLVSYKGGASKGADNFSNVYSYPNPIRPGYLGSVTVTGLQSNSRVKITDVSGNLINEGRSLGGQYVWNLQNARGKRVDSGVYLVFGSSDDGSEGVVTKIMVVN